MREGNEVRFDDLVRQSNEKAETGARPVPTSEKTPEPKPTVAPKKPKKQKTTKKTLKIIAIIVAGIAFLGLVGWGVYSYMELEKLQNPDYAKQQAEQESQDLVEKVGKLMELPSEEPVVATVSDKTKLADQPFFAKAENGDKVLIFSENSVAVIYRESADKIINSGPIAITSTEEE